jgi:NAD(P)-dependent dehydrogenase (short-subunit alcohol dehydrogenase family)
MFERASYLRYPQLVFFGPIRELEILYLPHVLVTLTKSSVGQGCKMTAHELRLIPAPSDPNPNLFVVTGDISDESSIQSRIAAAKRHHRLINIPIANAGITDESNSYPLWKIPLELSGKTHNTNIRGTFLIIKHFLQSA